MKRNVFVDRLNYNKEEKGGEYDYQDFFHLFLDIYITNLRECLQEWLINATSTVDHSMSKVESTFNLLPGEKIDTSSPNEKVYWSITVGKSVKQPYTLPGNYLQ